MCAIFGFYGAASQPASQQVKNALASLSALSVERGRDGMGALVQTERGWVAERYCPTPAEPTRLWSAEVTRKALAQMTGTLLVNVRAAPTTEWVGRVADLLQPYPDNRDKPTLWAVHNGTIANDRDWISEGIDSQAIPVAAASGDFESLVGSQATAMWNWEDRVIGTDASGHRIHCAADSLVLYRNFRPLAYAVTDKGVFFASKAEWLAQVLPGCQVQSMAADELLVFERDMSVRRHPMRRPNQGAVVVLSGGLDSTVCAAAACENHDSVVLAHFHYGCRAQTAETKAVTEIHRELAARWPEKRITLQFFDLSFLKQLGGSSLLDDTSEIAQGEAGAEYAHEWVPFRNGLMLSMIAAFCDRHSLGSIYLGANLEEAGAYGDNEVEFFEHFERALSIGSQAKPKIELPVGNLMKHEIVALAMKLKAPIHLSYSCYHGRPLHCGTCGPCYMRRQAFAINGIADTITYENKA